MTQQNHSRSTVLAISGMTCASCVARVEKALRAVPGVDGAILDPRSTWADKDEYDRTAEKLVDLFVDNFAQFAEHVEDGVKQAGPRVAA